MKIKASPFFVLSCPGVLDLWLVRNAGSLSVNQTGLHVHLTSSSDAVCESEENDFEQSGICWEVIAAFSCFHGALRLMA